MGGVNWRRVTWLAGLLTLASVAAACQAGGGSPPAGGSAASAPAARPASAGDGAGDGQGPRAGHGPQVSQGPSAGQALAFPLPTLPVALAPSGPSGLSASFTLGWYTADNLSYAAARIRALPVKPRIVNYYLVWGRPFNAAFARAAWADGVRTFVELEPWACDTCAEGRDPRLTSIAGGLYDRYLMAFGQAIKAFGHPLMVTFGHEMNGPWYPWGDGGSERATPAEWIAAWDHVVAVISGQAPGLTGWVWSPSVEPGTKPAGPYWPGDQYVDSVGIDGYLRTDTETYQSVFGATVAGFHRLTTRPIWIAETGLYINATTGRRLAAYVTAVKAAGLAGLLYFDRRPYTLRRADEVSLARALGTVAR